MHTDATWKLLLHNMHLARKTDESVLILEMLVFLFRPAPYNILCKRSVRNNENDDRCNAKRDHGNQ